jgi:hypothetical protein
MKKIIIFGLGCVMSLLTSADASKDQPEVVPTEMYCFATERIANELKRFGEVPIVMGLTSDLAGSTMSLWTNPANGSWTLVATKENISCILGAGNKLQILKSRSGTVI